MRFGCARDCAIGIGDSGLSLLTQGGVGSFFGRNRLPVPRSLANLILNQFTGTISGFEVWGAVGKNRVWTGHLHQNIRKQTGMRTLKPLTSPLKILTYCEAKEFEHVDELVRTFIGEDNIMKKISVEDACTTDDRGATMGVIRVLARGT